MGIHEKIPLMLVYKQDGKINADITEDAYTYELYGFLKCYVDVLEADLKDNLERK